MEIKIQTSVELNALLDALADQIVSANIYHRILRGLTETLPTYEQEIAQSRTFWHFSLHALRDAMLLHLCRVYDQHSSSLNLVNLLDTINANLHLFSEPHFRTRLAGNAFVDSLAQDNHIPDPAELQAHMNFASCQNPAVKKLMLWRNNIVAHRSAKLSLGKTEILTNNPLSGAEAEYLLERGLEILNKYSGLYKATTHSGKAICDDDFKHLLHFARLGRAKHEEDIIQQMKALGVHRDG